MRIAALPVWTLGHYLERGYLVSKPIGENGLWCKLFAATTERFGAQAQAPEFVALIRRGI